MKISVYSPVINEVDFIGYSIMAVLPYIHEILYGLATSNDGTTELIRYIKDKYDKDGKIKLFETNSEIDFDFDPLNMAAYNASYNYLIERATGDAVWFLHPDMIVTNPESILKVPEGPLAWWTNIKSFARDASTEIVVGRTSRWKNIQAKDFGAHYYGGYGSQNEDVYFRDITGDAYVHHGDKFELYPYEVADSGIHVNHYCEVKSYPRRLEKMKRCLRTLLPNADEKTIEEMAVHHPRVTLESSGSRFGKFEFAPSKDPIPPIFDQYRDEFAPFKKELVHA